MANRINGNIIIVDSAMGNNFILTSANLVRNLTETKIGAISFFSLSTLGNIIITNANTSLDVVFNCNYISIGALSNSGTVVTNPQQVTFPGGLRTSDLKVPTLAAGTAYLYLV